MKEINKPTFIEETVEPDQEDPTETTKMLDKMQEGLVMYTYMFKSKQNRFLISEQQKKDFEAD